MISKQGKLFGKIHVLDIVLIVLFIIVVFTAYGRLSNNEFISFGGSTSVKAQYTVQTYDYRASYFESLSVGDVIGEDKRYLDGKVTEIQIVDKIITLVDNNGDIIVGAHPELKTGIIKVEAMIEYKNPIYKMGKQELREGLPYFLTTETSNLSGIVIDIQILSE